MKAEDLYGQLSHTGKPFNCGYYVNGEYFAEGEEKERDLYLTENNIFDSETPNWESLHEECGDDFYYSEWLVEDDLDGGYDEDGNYYLFVDGKFVEENPFNLEDYEIVGGDGVTEEIWKHKSTEQIIHIPIEIVRDLDNIIFA